MPLLTLSDESFKVVVDLLKEQRGNVHALITSQDPKALAAAKTLDEILGAMSEEAILVSLFEQWKQALDRRGPPFCEKWTDSCLGGYHLSLQEKQNYEDWRAKHLAERHYGREPYAGAIGGSVTFHFTGTSLGVISAVRCGLCRDLEPHNITDWDNFG